MRPGTAAPPPVAPRGQYRSRAGTEPVYALDDYGEYPSGGQGDFEVGAPGTGDFGEPGPDGGATEGVPARGPDGPGTGPGVAATGPGVPAGGEGQAATEGAEMATVAPGAPTGTDGLPGGQAVRRGRRRHWGRTVALVVAVALVVVAGVGFVRVNDDINPPGHPGRVVTVTLPRGSSTVHIAHLLADAEVIHGPDVFAAYVKLKGAGPLLAGTYRLATNEGYGAVISALQSGPPPALTYTLVVPEGFTVRQIAAAVARLPVGITVAHFLAATHVVRSPYEPRTKHNLEGLLFPATYPVPRGETAVGLVRWMVRTFDRHATALGLSNGARRLGYSPYQVVKVASIVEREAKFNEDRGPIASAIYNRLAARMPIGAESTLLYADPNGSNDPTTASPYNTLLHKGLPPTPISSPGLPSLEAALNPPDTTFLYWVEVDPDGKMGFGTTPAQFRQLQHECRVAHLC